MSWQTLTAAQKIRSHAASKREMDDLRAVIERDLADAAISALSADRRFATAYNAALQTATMAVACAGYRTSGLGHHETTFEAADLAIGDGSAALTAYFESCRRKRNTLDYDRAHAKNRSGIANILLCSKEEVLTVDLLRKSPYWKSGDDLRKRSK
jgi:hypothetical protein